MKEANKKNKIPSYIWIGIAILFVIGGILVFFLFRDLIKPNLKTLEQEWAKEVWEDYEFE